MLNSSDSGKQPFLDPDALESNSQKLAFLVLHLIKCGGP